MAFMYFPIQLFDEETFQQCIVVPFPTNGKIVDIQVVDKTAFLLVDADVNAAKTFAHFHIVPVLTPLFADSHEYVGTLKISNFRGTEQAMLTVIRIPNGDFGIHSQEYIAQFGQAEHDKFVAAQAEQAKTESEFIPPAETVSDKNDADVPTSDDFGLRSVWDIFDKDGKTKADTTPPTQNKPKRKRVRKNKDDGDKTNEG